MIFELQHRRACCGHVQVDVTCSDRHTKWTANQEYRGPPITTPASTAPEEPSHHGVPTKSYSMVLNDGTLKAIAPSAMCAAFVLSDIENSALRSNSTRSILVNSAFASRITLVLWRHTLPTAADIRQQKVAYEKGIAYKAEPASTPVKYYYRATAVADLTLPKELDALPGIFENGKVVARGPVEQSVGEAALGLDEELIAMVGGCAARPGRASYASAKDVFFGTSDAWTAVKLEIKRDTVAVALTELMQGTDVD